MLDIIRLAIAFYQRGWVSDEGYTVRARRIVTPHRVIDDSLVDRIEYVVEMHRNGHWVRSGTYEVEVDAFTNFLRETIRPEFTESPFNNEEVIMALVKSEPLEEWVSEAVKRLVARDPIVTDALRDALRC